MKFDASKHRFAITQMSWIELFSLKWFYKITSVFDFPEAIASDANDFLEEHRSRGRFLLMLGLVVRWATFPSPSPGYRAPYGIRFGANCDLVVVLFARYRVGTHSVSRIISRNRQSHSIYTTFTILAKASREFSNRGNTKQKFRSSHCLPGFDAVTEWNDGP